MNNLKKTTLLNQPPYKDVFNRIDALLQIKSSAVVAIDGNSGAGKSSLASVLSKKYDCNVFHMDHFFLTPALRTQERLNEVGGNVDYVRFYKEVMTGLQKRVSFQYRIYNCFLGELDQTVQVPPKKLNVIEGCYSMHPTLISYYDFKIFITIGKEEQSARILKRSGPLLHQRFLHEWIPLENRYFNELNIMEKCDLSLQG